MDMDNQPGPRRRHDGPSGLNIIGVQGNVTADTLYNIIQVGTSRITTFFQVDDPFQFFEGREQEMNNIHMLLQSSVKHRDIMKRTVVLTGFGGIGKSELARKFVKNFKNSYPNVAWLNAATEREITTCFRKLGDNLGVPRMHDEEPHEHVERIYEYIDKNCRGLTLLVFDNVECLGNSSTKFGIQDYLPKSQSLTNRPLILMTSQTESLEKSIPSGNFVRVDALGEGDVMNFFASFFELDETSLQRVILQLRELHNLLQGYPLALTISAGQIDRGKTVDDLNDCLSTYIESLRSRLDTFMNKNISDDVYIPSGYRNTMTAVWDIAIQRIRAHTKANDMFVALRVLSFTEPDFIEEKEVQDIATRRCPFIAEYVDFRLSDPDHGTRGALLALVKLCILRIVTTETNKGDSHYRIHRLIQLLARRLESDHVGAGRALYYCLDFEPPFVFTGCIEHLMSFVNGKVPPEEPLKHLYLAAIIINRGAFSKDVVELAVDYFNRLDGNESATKHLLRLIQAANLGHEEQQMGAGAVLLSQQVEQVLDTAIEWSGNSPLEHLIQNCASKTLLSFMFKYAAVLTDGGLTQVVLQKLKTWMTQQVEIGNCLSDRQIAESKVLHKCMYRVFRTAIKIIEYDHITDVSEFVRELVNDHYKFFKDDFELRDGYWHIYSGCLRLEGCRAYVAENVPNVVENAVDSLQKSNQVSKTCEDGFLDCLIFLALVPEYVAEFCRHNSFLRELVTQVKIRLKSGRIANKDVYWGLFLVTAWMQEPQKVELTFLSCFGLEILSLKDFFDELIRRASTLYRRWKPVMGDVLSGFQNGNQFLETLKEFAKSEAQPKSVMEPIFREQIKKLLQIFEK